MDPAVGTAVDETQLVLAEVISPSSPAERDAGAIGGIQQVGGFGSDAPVYSNTAADSDELGLVGDRPCRTWPTCDAGGCWLHGAHGEGAVGAASGRCCQRAC